MPNKAYQKQLEEYIDTCKLPEGKELKKMNLMEWSNKKLEELTKEEIFLIVSTQKCCYFDKKTTKTIQYLINKTAEKHGKNNVFSFVNLFAYGLMLGKAWERANIKY